MQAGLEDTRQMYMETNDPCSECDSLGRLVVKDEPTGLIQATCVSCGHVMMLFPIDPDGNECRPLVYDREPCSTPVSEGGWRDVINNLACCKIGIDRLAAYIQERFPEEFECVDSSDAEEVVGAVTRLLDRLVGGKTGEE